jgi:hypothetical protein
VKEQKKLLLLQLKSVRQAKKNECDEKYGTTSGVDMIVVICAHIEILADKENLI